MSCVAYSALCDVDLKAYRLYCLAVARHGECGERHCGGHRGGGGCKGVGGYLDLVGDDCLIELGGVDGKGLGAVAGGCGCDCCNDVGIADSRAGDAGRACEAGDARATAVSADSGVSDVVGGRSRSGDAKADDKSGLPKVSVKGPNYDRNRLAREKKKRHRANKIERRRSWVDPDAMQAREDYAEVHGVSAAELDVDEFVKGESVGVVDVLSKADMKSLAVQRAGLYKLRNQREELRLKREIMMEEATLEAGANEARVGNWIAEVKSGKSKSSGMSCGTTSSGKFTKRSAWSAGSWRTREKSDQTCGSSFVTEEEHQKVVEEHRKVVAESQKVAAKAEAFRIEAETVKRVVADLRREIAYLTQGDKFHCDDVMDEIGMVPSWDFRK